MLTINLLPPEKKRAVRLEEKGRLLRLFALGAAAAFGVGSVLLIPSFLPLYLEQKEVERSLILEEQASRKLGIDITLARIHKMRTSADAIKSFTQTPPRASSFLDFLFGEAGGGIKLEAVTVKKDGLVALVGRSRTRSDLLSYEKRLRDSGRFQEITLRLSDILREENIDFTLQGKLKVLHSL
ncbi:MAG: hypothetical protein HYW89_01465 [Candidatus Sungiibacteriota bacterium]|uniref:PilN domain-containing protein n=1 Tax=Candidatus Sungiibacteriota bacterium TaxID=2750080 RepID=A0A7T5URI4_9BACT|nr:MAG: hypothetical protein HYW89_01465 [Candidatus Sungbacteria bacterium]